MVAAGKILSPRLERWNDWAGEPSDDALDGDQLVIADQPALAQLRRSSDRSTHPVDRHAPWKVIGMV
jgi:hypothetical protein